ncbi:hypothetical protein RIR_jg8584.t1 [Rhizophagus irregularis DAOM 181602=DAOM 197198]|nr:hypothetical protein RIR_jg8584.t1 [Rhizophagus irregularis DAOM 181602=DAOM 197198]
MTLVSYQNSFISVSYFDHGIFLTISTLLFHLDFTYTALFKKIVNLIDYRNKLNINLEMFQTWKSIAFSKF